jgi:Pectate lyase superfamily protein
MLKRFSILFVLLFTVSAFAQNTFEGANIIVDAAETQTSYTCAIRYSSQTVKITDLDAKTPMAVSACGNSNSVVTKTSASTMEVRANAGGKWCFNGEDKKYRISFAGDRFTPQVTYDWFPTTKTTGIYNIKDFGAVGDGKTDDTMAIRSALAFVATRNGGLLQFPEGDFLVGGEANFKGLTIPSGITIQGVGSLASGSPTNNIIQVSPSRITLNGMKRAIFRIGECTEKVAIRDIELFANINQDTYGIEAVGGYSSAQDLEFTRVTFNNFFRGMYFHALASTDFNWQCDFIKVIQCRFVYNRDAGIWCKVRNSDWKISGNSFLIPRKTESTKADAMYFYHSGNILIEDTFGGGFVNAVGGTFLNIIDGANLTVINSQTEAMTNSMIYGDVPGAGDYSYPITFVNNIFGHTIEFKARRTFVSTGNLYGPKTFKADERLRLYSTGDRFCYDGYTLGCEGSETNNFDKASIMFMTGQPTDQTVKGRPTIFGTDVQFNQSIQLPSFLQTALPAGKSNGSMVYCSNCRRNSSPCQSGGSGSPAMMVSGSWSCL